MYNSFKSKKKIKVAIITNIPTPYRKKQWEYYSNCECLDITVFYCANTEKDRHWKIESSESVKEVFLKGLSFKSIHFNLGILKVVLQDFDVFFVGGYGYPSVIMSIVALKLLKKHCIMIIDGVSPLKLKNENFIIENIKKLLIKGADAYFANGTVGAKYLEKYGIFSEKIFNQYMTVDVDYFMNKGNDLTKFRSEIRQKYGITEDLIVVMYAGRLIEHKGVQDLINAIKNLKNKNINIKALIIGEGNFRLELEKQSEDMRSDVIFTGHINPEELYKYYYASDIFVLPTYDDPWGLVINEAMACGLPVIVTDAAGCSLDLVKDNGYIVKSHDVEELSIALEKIIEKRIKFGNNSHKRILRWTYKESLNSFIEVITHSGFKLSGYMSQKYENQLFNPYVSNENKNLVSIIVPAYKADKYLKECLESLLTQTYPFFEIIVVVEESEIDTKKILNNYKNNDKLRIIEEKKNLGPAHTRNLAIKHSKGNYITFCDADDIFKPEKIEEQIKLISDVYGLIYTDFYLIDEERQIIDKINTPEWNFNDWIKGGYVAFSTVFVKKTFLEEVNFMDENLSSNEDFDLLIKLSKITEFKRVPKFLAYRRLHNSNLSKNKETLISRYYIYKKYDYNFLAVQSLIWGFIYSNIFYFLIKHESLYFIVKSCLKK